MAQHQLLFLIFALMQHVGNVLSAAAIKETETLKLWPPNPAATLGLLGASYQPGKELIRIGYVLGDFADNFYNGNELDQIQKVTDTINKATKGCVKFYHLLNPNQTSHPLHIRKSTGAPITGSTLCSTFTGMANAAAGQGQMMVLFGGETIGACLGQNKDRDLLRYFLNTLGILNEFRHPNRSKIIEMASNVASTTDINPGFFEPYTSAQVLLPFEDVDIESATMITERRYAKNPSNPVFSFKGATPTLTDALSYYDCKTINHVYRCGITCEYNPVTPTQSAAILYIPWVESVHCAAVGPGNKRKMIGELQLNQQGGPVTFALVSNPEYIFELDSVESKNLNIRKTLNRGFVHNVVVKATLAGPQSYTAQETLQIKIDCIPQLRYNNDIVKCHDVNGDESVTDLTCRNASPQQRKLPCRKDDQNQWYLRAGSSLGTFTAFDPDQTTTQFDLLRAESTDDMGNPINLVNWKYWPADGSVKWQQADPPSSNLVPSTGAKITLVFEYSDDMTKVTYNFGVDVTCDGYS